MTSRLTLTHHLLLGAPKPAALRSCACCSKVVGLWDGLWCNGCDKVYHWGCFRTPIGLFPSRLPEGAAESARWGDCRRDDFTCPHCNFVAQMGREPRQTERDWYLGMCDMQLTLNEWHKDAETTARGYYYAIQKLERWGKEFGMQQKMVADSMEELGSMNADHRRVGWYFVDQTRRYKHGTMKKIRAALCNKYLRMPGMDEHWIPTSTFQFRCRMDGLLQRLGDSAEQDKVFRKQLLSDLVALMISNYRRARGERRVEMAQVNLALHAYIQAGFRANEIFRQQMGKFRNGFVFGVDGVRDHISFTGAVQTKENRYYTTTVLCSYAAKRAPLCAGRWARVVVHERERVGRVSADEYVFATPQGQPWTMTWLWNEHIAPALHQLQTEGLGGLAGQDLSRYGSNSFRRTWNTMAAALPGPVSPDLRDRQARWRFSRRRAQAMSSLYADPDVDELLLATYWL